MTRRGRPISLLALASSTLLLPSPSIGAASLQSAPTLAADSWVALPQTKLLASDAQPDEWFGFSLAVEGNTAIVGARLGDFAGADAGAAYVFERSVGDWTEQQVLVGADTSRGDSFGYSIALSADRAVIGAPFDDDHGNGSGSAYVFVRSGSSWIEESKLVPFDGNVLDGFGTSVTIDGDTIVVGAPGDDDSGENAGSAYVFRHQAGVWSLESKLLANDLSVGAVFGSTVEVQGDELVLGAPFDQASGTNSGSAYVFQRTASVWAPAQKLYIQGGSSTGKFGLSIALTGDHLVIGAPGEHTAGSQAGAVVVYERSGSTWAGGTQILAPDGAAFDSFGIAVEIDEDLLVVCSTNADTSVPNAGAVYVFSHRVGAWQLDHKSTASDAEPQDSLGWSCALNDGTLLVGCWPDDDGGSYAGSVYVLDVQRRTTSFCAGDGLDPELIPCPCANAGATGHGCANSQHTAGARLDAGGLLAPNELQMTCTELPSATMCFFVGTYDVLPSGATFGDGLRCIAGKRFRFGRQLASGAGATSSEVPTAPPGRSAYYQVWYRDAATDFCTAGTFNTSNGLRIVW